MRLSIYLAAALPLTATLLATMPAARAQGAGPFAHTVILSETVINVRGQSAAGSLQTLAVRSDGSRMLRLGTAEGGSRIINFASGVEVMTNDRTRLKSTVRKPFTLKYRDPAADCTDPEEPKQRVLARETIAGYRTVKIAADAKATAWYALDRGCAEVKSKWVFASGQSSEWHLVALFPGEPEEALFAVADYKEGPPSALEGPVDLTKCGPECQQRRKQRLQEQDAAYYKNRP